MVIEFLVGGIMKPVEIFDETLCALGEGPIWHPLRESLIWFDIMGKSLFERKILDSKARKLSFENYVSAAGWINENALLMATSRDLVKYFYRFHDTSNQKLNDHYVITNLTFHSTLIVNIQSLMTEHG
jgi:sugar lactone lactonase YvrE